MCFHFLLSVIAMNSKIAQFKAKKKSLKKIFKLFFLQEKNLICFLQLKKKKKKTVKEFLGLT